MLRRAHKLREYLRLFVKTWGEDISALGLDEHEWHHIEYLLRLLYDFWLYTTCLSEHTGPTIHRVSILTMVCFYC